jgi:hypothetical protein
MNPQKAQLKRLNELKEVAVAAHNKWQKYREKLALVCEHPSDMVVDYTWEHDDGYGRQTMITGKQCVVCFAKDHWNRGMFSK